MQARWWRLMSAITCLLTRVFRVAIRALRPYIIDQIPARHHRRLRAKFKTFGHSGRPALPRGYRLRRLRPKVNQRFGNYGPLTLRSPVFFNWIAVSGGYGRSTSPFERRREVSSTCRQARQEAVAVGRKRLDDLGLVHGRKRQADRWPTRPNPCVEVLVLGMAQILGRPRFPGG
jgi:hypothetical protein